MKDFTPQDLQTILWMCKRTLKDPNAPQIPINDNDVKNILSVAEKAYEAIEEHSDALFNAIFPDKSRKRRKS